MPNNHKTYKLSEITTKIGSGATPRGGKEAYKESGISLIRSQNVLDFTFSTNGLAFIDEIQANALKNVIVESRDVLLNITGDSVARVCQVPDEWIPARVNQHVAIIRANQEILYPEFLLYSLLSKENKNTLLTLASAGATRNAITKSMIEDFELSIPPLQEQKAIANILTAIANKIELNLQQNKTLEEMAMTLYKHWFVDFNFPTEQTSPPGEGCLKGGVVHNATAPQPQTTPSPQPKTSIPNGEGCPKDSVVLNAKETSIQSVTTPQPKTAVPKEPENLKEGEVPHIKRNAKNYFELPYNPKLKERARALRKAGNLAEVLFWLEVKNKKFKGLDFDRQKIIGNYIVDFYCANVNVVIEVDGSSHDNKQEYDAKRDAYLQSLGLTVIHITDGDVKKNMEYTLRELKAHPAFDLSELVSDEVQLHTSDHPTFQAPLPRRGTNAANKFPSGGGVSAGRGGALHTGYKNSGGEMVNSELGMIPKGWEVKRLDEVTTLLAGGDKPKKYSKQADDLNKIPIYSNGISNEGLYGFTNISRINEESVTISARGTIGFVFLRLKPFFPIVRLISAIPNKELISAKYLFLFLRNQNISGTGTTQQQLTVPDFSRQEVIIPVNQVIENFTKIVDSVYLKIDRNKSENQTLTKLRDTVLPKLISGEVRVKDIEKTVKSAL